MKIIYCLIDCSQTGGMERTICCKANYLADIMGYDVTIITTDQSDRPAYYHFSEKIKFFDLGIDYGELKNLSTLQKLKRQIQKRKLHKQKLSLLLKKLQADIVISTYSHEFTLLHDIEDGSKKIAEIHFSKEYNQISNKYLKQSFASKLMSSLAEKRKYLFIKKYDRFVVLTKKDLENFSHFNNVVQIYNQTSFYPEKPAPLQARRVISVGRLSFEKRYTLLIEAWSIVSQYFPDWKLDIFGSGDEYPALEKLIHAKQLSHLIKINAPTSNIEEEYLQSSVFVMTSLFEGFPMVLLEAMSCGLPCVSFNCPHGPSEIIANNEDGFLVENGNTQMLAEKIMQLIQNMNLRIKMGTNAREDIKKFSSDTIMKQWISLFKELISENVKTELIKTV